jgi:4-hydroxy-tetrahydrodipicolinate synthase
VGSIISMEIRLEMLHREKDQAASMNLVTETYAALSVPRDMGGNLDAYSFRQEIEFLLSQGIRGMVINGATGECCVATSEDLCRMLEIAQETTAGRAAYFCGIGSASVQGSIENGRIAAQGGAKCLLLPPPHYFPYEQDDLDAFCRKVAESASLPILLYNLPQFTNNIFQPKTVVNLLMDVPNIVGIKDSSGSLDVLRAMTRAGVGNRVVGNDSVLAQALRERVCDGVISGVACAVPELLVALFGQRHDPDSPQFNEAANVLAEFIEHLNAFPVPWGLKWIQESRGISPATFSQPVSERRTMQGRDFQAWFQGWREKAGIGPWQKEAEALR